MSAPRMTYTLDEDLKRIGVGFDEINRLAHGHMYSSLEESIDQEAKGDPIDGPYVTRELLNRIINLPHASMTVEHYDATLTGLSAKVLPEGDQELISMTKRVVEMLRSKRDDLVSDEGVEGVEADEADEAEGEGLDEASRRIKVRTQAGKRIRTQKTSEKKKRASKRYYRTGGRRARQKRERRYAAGKFSPEMLKTARKQGKSRAELKQQFRGESEVAGRLAMASMLEADDAVPSLEEAVIDRIGRIFELLHDQLGHHDGVTEAYDECWENMLSLAESSDDSKAIFEPAMRIIAESLDLLEEGHGLMAYTDAVSGAMYSAPDTVHPDDEERGWGDDDDTMDYESINSLPAEKDLMALAKDMMRQGVLGEKPKVAYAAMEASLEKLGYDTRNISEEWYEAMRQEVISMVGKR